jgi:hypothetical protein
MHAKKLFMLKVCWDRKDTQPPDHFMTNDVKWLKTGLKELGWGNELGLFKLELAFFI